MKKNKDTKKIKATWTAADRQAFADGNRLRASTVPNKKREASRKACRGAKVEI